MPRKTASIDLCVLCKQARELTFHHLIPRKMHRRTHFRKHFSKTELNQGIEVCRPCHKGLHRLYDEMTLAKQFYSLELLLTDPQIQKHIQWSGKLKLSNNQKL